MKLANPLRIGLQKHTIFTVTNIDAINWRPIINQ
jgi:hypothetical protein